LAFGFWLGGEAIGFWLGEKAIGFWLLAIGWVCGLIRRWLLITALALA
jgi:hypothetical protein